MKQLGPEVCSHILFLHAVLGCDTTSRLYSIGKGNSLKSSSQINTFVNKPEHLMYSQLPPKMSLLQGNECWSAFYNGKNGENLDSLRYKQFCQKIATNTIHVQLQTLPPTSAAAKYHSLRVYTFRYSSGKGLGMIFLQENGGGKKVKKDLSQYSLTCLQHHKNYYI